MKTLIVLLVVWFGCCYSSVSLARETEPAQFEGDGGRYIAGTMKPEVFDFVGKSWFAKTKIQNNQAKFDLTGHPGSAKIVYAQLIVPVFTYEKEYQLMDCTVNGAAITLKAEGRGALLAMGTQWNKVIHKVYTAKDADLVKALNSGNSASINFPEFQTGSYHNPWFDQYPTSGTCYLLLGFADPKATHMSGILAAGPVVPGFLTFGLDFFTPDFKGVKNQDIRVISSGYFLSDIPKYNNSLIPELILEISQMPISTVISFDSYFRAKTKVPRKGPGIANDYVVDISLKNRNLPDTPSLKPMGRLQLSLVEKSSDSIGDEQVISSSFYCLLWESSLPIKNKQPTTRTASVCSVFVPGFCASMSSSLFGKEGDYTYTPIAGYKIKLNSDWKPDPITNSYDKLINVLGDLPGGVEVCGYDWRKTADEVVDQYLIPAIDRAKAKTGYEKVQIVAHSTGNLVVFRYMTSSRYRGDISRWVALAPPFRGSGNAYDIWNGANLSSYTFLGKLGYEKFIFDVMNMTSQKRLFTKSDTVSFIQDFMPGLAGLLPCGSEFSVIDGKSGQSLQDGTEVLHNQNLYAKELTNSKSWQTIEDELDTNLVVYIGTGFRTATGIKLLNKPRPSLTSFGLGDGPYELIFSTNGDGTVADYSANFLKKARIIRVNCKHALIPDLVSANKIILTNELSF